MSEQAPDLSLTPQHLEPPDDSIPIHLINIPKDRARKEFKNIIPLRDSIVANGLINPITVSLREDGKYYLIAGETRLQACAKIPWLSIPCYIKKGLTELQEKEIELEENIKRTNLNWQEETLLMEQIDSLKRSIHGSAMPRSKDDKGWSLSKTAELTNKSIGGASDQIKFAKLMKERPDITERIKHLPYTHAKKEFARILDTERLERIMQSGELKVNVNFTHGDAIELSKTIPENSIDLVVWDPPFGLDALEDEGNDTVSGMLKSADNMSTSDAREVMEKLIVEMARVLKPSAHFYIFFAFKQYTFLTELFKKLELEFFDQPLIWDKGQATTIARGYNYMSGYEPILYGWKPPRDKRLATSMKNILPFKPVSKKGKLHAFEKPLDLLTALIKQSSSLGDSVLDFTAGSGSTLVAALQSGRCPVGFELDKEHYLRASARLAEEESFVKEQPSA